MNGVKDRLLGVLLNEWTEAIQRPAWGCHGRLAGRRSYIYLVEFPLSTTHAQYERHQRRSCEDSEY
jgi:hypothetical protein